MIQSSPSRRAGTSYAPSGLWNSSGPTKPASEPWWGSVMAQQPTYFASRSLRKGSTISPLSVWLPGRAAEGLAKGKGKDVPEEGAFPDHVSGVGKLVQLHTGWPRHLLRKAVRLLPDSHFLRREASVQVQVVGQGTPRS